jgi:hypothetical protein
MPTSKPFFYEFTTRKKIWGTFTKFCAKNVLCEKGDEITRFDGNPHKCKVPQKMSDFFTTGAFLG